MIKQALTNIIVKCSFMNKVTEASSPVAVTSISDFTCFKQEVLWHWGN